jgi:ABC-type Fe3+/spermidine/putrescine transport system ATPase subunit
MQVEINGVFKRFGPLQVLKDCTLHIDRGEVITLLGPSGCGKTTLLRCIAGFYIPEQGSIVLEGRDVTLVPPNKRDVGLIFQNYALFPHLSVRKNVAYGLSVRRVERGEIERRVAEALALVSLSDLAERYPSQLSGGQQQRVAIARALVLEPEIVLLDEPFNALDAKLRVTMQVELRKLVKKLGMTSIFVTHDQTEALTISDRIAIMREGELEQVAEPLTIYDAPQSSYVANFIGSANLIEVETRGGLVEIAPGISLPTSVQGSAAAVVRPENITIAPRAGGQTDGWIGVVSFVKPLGSTVEYEVEVDGRAPVRVMALRGAKERTLAVGEAVALDLRDPGACVVLEARGP